MHAVGGKAVGAAGDYFRRLAASELAAADPLKVNPSPNSNPNPNPNPDPNPDPDPDPNPDH